MALEDEYRGFMSPKLDIDQNSDQTALENITAPIEVPDKPVEVAQAGPSPVPTSTSPMNQQVDAAMDFGRADILMGSDPREQDPSFVDAQKLYNQRIAINRKNEVPDLSKVNPATLRKYDITPPSPRLELTGGAGGFGGFGPGYHIADPEERRQALKRHAATIQDRKNKASHDAEIMQKYFVKELGKSINVPVSELPHEIVEFGKVGLQALKTVIKHDTPEMVKLGIQLGYLTADYGREFPDLLKNGLIRLNNWFDWSDSTIKPLDYALNKKAYHAVNLQGFRIPGPDGEPLRNNKGDILTVSAETAARHTMDQLGISDGLANLADLIIGDVNVPLEQRGFLDRALYKGVEFGTPLMIIPFIPMAGLGFKLYKGVRGRDIIAMKKFAKKEAIQMAEGDMDYAEILATEILTQLKAAKKASKGSKPSSATVSVVKEDNLIDQHIINYEHIDNSDFYKQIVSELRLHDRLGRAASAGIYGGAAETLIQAAYGPDWREEFGAVPYAFAMIGYMNGGKGIGKLAFRMPGGAIPFAGLDPLNPISYIPPRAAGGAVNAIALNAWGLTLWGRTKFHERRIKLIEQQGGFPSAKDYEDLKISQQNVDNAKRNPLALASMYIAAGGEFPKAMAELGKIWRNKVTLEEGLDTFEQMIGGQRFNPKIIARLARNMEDMPKEDRERVEIAIDQAMKLVRDISDGDVDKMNENMLLINEVMALGDLQSLYKELTSTLEWKDAGGLLKNTDGALRAIGNITSKLNPFSARKGFFGKLDIMMAEQQRRIGSLSQKILDMKKDKGPATETGKRFLEATQSILDQRLRKYNEQLEDRRLLMSELEKTGDKWGTGRLTRFANETTTDSDEGMLLSKYDPRNPATEAENYEAFHADSMINQRATFSIIREQAKKLYKDANMDQVWIPITNFVNSIDEDTLFTNQAVMALLGNPAKINVKNKFVTSARKNYLDNHPNLKTPDQLKVWLAGLQDTIPDLRTGANKIAGDAWFGNIYDRLNEMTAAGIEDLTSEAGEKIKLAIAGLTTRKIATSDGGYVLEQAEDFLGYFPAIARLSDMHDIHLSTFNKLNSAVSDPIKLREVVNNAKRSRTALEADILDEDANTAIMEEHGLDPAMIEQALKDRAKAQENYRLTIGETFKSYLGRHYNLSDRDVEKMATVPLVEERWTSWLFDNRRSEAGSLMSAAMFNRIYPKGNEKIKIEIPVSVRDRTVGDIDIDPATEKLIEQNGKGLTETIETTKDEIRKNAIDFISHSIALRIRDEDYTWIEKTNETTIKELEKAGIIKEGVARELIEYKSAISTFKKTNIPKSVIQLTKNINNKLETLTNVQRENIREVWNPLFQGGGAVRIEDIVRSMFDADFVTKLGDKESQLGPLLREIVDLEESLLTLQKKYQLEPTEGLEKAIAQHKQSIEDLRTSTYAQPMNELLDIVGDNLEILDDFEDLVYDYIYRSSLEFSDKKASVLTRFTGKMEEGFSTTDPSVVLSPLEKALKDSPDYELLRRLGLVTEDNPGPIMGQRLARVNFDKMEQALARAIPMLASLHAARLAKGYKLEETKQSIKNLDLLQSIYGYEVRMLGGVPVYRRVANVPADMLPKQRLGRLYNWARGFVHPGYLVAESTFMKLGLNEAKLIGGLLQDKNVVPILAAVERGENISLQKFATLAKATTRLLRGAAAANKMDPVTERQLYDFYIAFTGQLPPKYLKRLQTEREQREKFESTRRTRRLLTGQRDAGDDWKTGAAFHGY